MHLRSNLTLSIELPAGTLAAARIDVFFDGWSIQSGRSWIIEVCLRKHIGQSVNLLANTRLFIQYGIESIKDVLQLAIARGSRWSGQRLRLRCSSIAVLVGQQALLRRLGRYGGGISSNFLIL